MNRVSESVDAGATWASSASGVTTSTSRAASSSRIAVSSSSSSSCSTANASSADSSIAPRSSASSRKAWPGVGKVIVLRSFTPSFGSRARNGDAAGATQVKTLRRGPVFPSRDTSETAGTVLGRAPNCRPLRGPLYRSAKRRSPRVDPTPDPEGGRLRPRPRPRRRLQTAQLDDPPDRDRGKRRRHRRTKARGQGGGPAGDPPLRGDQRRHARDGRGGRAREGRGGAGPAGAARGTSRGAL